MSFHLADFYMVCQEHESQREKLIMEKDAVVNELSTLEEQLAVSKSQIKSLSDTLEIHKSKVLKN
jgi:structural maintenance of chromosome 2